MLLHPLAQLGFEHGNVAPALALLLAFLLIERSELFLERARSPLDRPRGTCVLL